MRAAAALCVTAACAKKSPEVFTGYIADATMNTVTVRSLSSEETYTFTTDAADRSEAYGLLVGAPAIVEYRGRLDKGAEAVKVATDPTYAAAVGRWTAADPIAPDQVVGIDLGVEGEASSIRMATLLYTDWELQGEADRILLKGQSLGNGQTIEFTQTGILSKDADGRRYLTIEETGQVYTKAEEPLRDKMRRGLRDSGGLAFLASISCLSDRPDRGRLPDGSQGFGRAISRSTRSTTRSGVKAARQR